MKTFFSKHIFFLLSAFVLMVSVAQAQYLREDKAANPEFDGKRWVFGGDFALQFGTTTYINISPLAGYRITPRATLGAGISYQYLHEKISYAVSGGGNFLYEYKTMIYGPKAWGSYVLFSNLDEALNISIKNIILYSEYEALNVDSFYFDSMGRIVPDGRRWIGSMLLGGGVQMPIGKDAFVNLLLLYNLNQSIYTPYSNPVLRVNFNF